MVLDCDQLGDIEEIQDITPIEFSSANAETFGITIDPVNHGVVYVGGFYTGLWKTEDCGANWAKVSTGTLSSAIDNSMTWSMAVDPIDPQVIYAVAGYSSGVSGLYKSTNGGEDWVLSWPPASQPEWHDIVITNFANVVTMNPENHLHLLLTFHNICLPPHNEMCFAESFDGGETWRFIEGLDDWTGYEGSTLFFIDSTTWFFTSQLVGSWILSGMDDPDNYVAERIDGLDGSHIQGFQFIQSKTGRFFSSGSRDIWTSADGSADSWQRIPNTGPIIGGLVETENAIYASNCFFPDYCVLPEYTKSTDNGATWQNLNVPFYIMLGGPMVYDPEHKLIYSTTKDRVIRFRVN